MFIRKEQNTLIAKENQANVRLQTEKNETRWWMWCKSWSDIHVLLLRLFICFFANIGACCVYIMSFKSAIHSIVKTWLGFQNQHRLWIVRQIGREGSDCEYFQQPINSKSIWDQSTYSIINESIRSWTEWIKEILCFHGYFSGDVPVAVRFDHRHNFWCCDGVCTRFIYEERSWRSKIVSRKRTNE